VRVTAKRLDIFVHPLEGRGDVQDPLIARRCIFFAAEVGQEEISE
jgi:hypothetical protein